MHPILRKILSLTSQQPPLDPAQFNDPLALKTEWTPATRGGSSFRTHRLVQDDFARVEFKASTGAKVFYLLFAFIGVGVATGMALFSEAESYEAPEFFVPMLMGILFLSIGVGMFIYGTTPIVFDKGSGYFWKGRKGPQDVLEVSSLKKCAQLGQIHAIQLVSEYVRSGKSSFYSYELNLVLEDARRLTVIDHGNLKRLREDAGKLSEFLGKPIWDAIGR